ncbi:MAG: hypothetical protein AB7N76_25135 [Planctomycetota bacterium]
MESLLVTHACPDHDATCVFEDDGRVAYAYLRLAGAIVADVWIYNADLTPSVPEWTERGTAPYRNARAYVQARDSAAPLRPSDLAFDWPAAPAELAPVVFVSILGVLVAVLAPGAKPGWSRLATRPGPLALPLDELPASLVPLFPPR